MIQQVKDVEAELKLPSLHAGEAALRKVSYANGSVVELVARFSDEEIQEALGNEDNLYGCSVHGMLMSLSATLVRVPLDSFRSPVSLVVVGLEVQADVDAMLHSLVVINPGSGPAREMAAMLMRQDVVPVVVAGETLYARHEEAAEDVATDLKFVMGRAEAAYERTVWTPEHAEEAEAALRRRFYDPADFWQWSVHEEDSRVLRLPR